jgi:hypothetical protein
MFARVCEDFTPEKIGVVCLWCAYEFSGASQNSRDVTHLLDRHAFPSDEQSRRKFWEKTEQVDERHVVRRLRFKQWHAQNTL